MKTDIEYRDDLIRSGVRADLIEVLSSHDLDRVGNIVGVYRTSMLEQDPIAHRIKQFAVARGLPQYTTEARTLRDHFAGLAMQALLSRAPANASDVQLIPEFSYELADAMLKERNGA